MLQRILFMGPPGCGKGTYAKHVAPLLGASHVSTGDLVRNEVKRGTPLGNRLHAANTAGALVDDSDILELLLPVLKDGKCIML
jgi:adenylate kinase